MKIIIFTLLLSINVFASDQESLCREAIVDAHELMGESIGLNSFSCAHSLEELGVSDEDYEQLNILEKIALRVKLNSVQKNSQNAFINLQVFARAKGLTHSGKYLELISRLKGCVNNLESELMDRAHECVPLAGSNWLRCANLNERTDSIELTRLLTNKDSLGYSLQLKHANPQKICEEFGLGNYIVNSKVIKRDKVAIPRGNGRQSPKMRKRKTLYSIECEKSQD